MELTPSCLPPSLSHESNMVHKRTPSSWNLLRHEHVAQSGLSRVFPGKIPFLFPARVRPPGHVLLPKERMKVRGKPREGSGRRRGVLIIVFTAILSPTFRPTICICYCHIEYNPHFFFLRLIWVLSALIKRSVLFSGLCVTSSCFSLYNLTVSLQSSLPSTPCPRPTDSHPYNHRLPTMCHRPYGFAKNLA